MALLNCTVHWDATLGMQPEVYVNLVLGCDFTELSWFIWISISYVSVPRKCSTSL
jgi:hypothetical protein